MARPVCNSTAVRPGTETVIVPRARSSVIRREAGRDARGPEAGGPDADGAREDGRGPDAVRLGVTGIRAIAAGEGLIIAAETTGKYKMALQVVAIVMLILEGTSLAALGNLHLAGIVTLYLSLVLVALPLLLVQFAQRRLHIQRGQHRAQREGGRDDPGDVWRLGLIDWWPGRYASCPEIYG